MAYEDACETCDGAGQVCDCCGKPEERCVCDNCCAGDYSACPDCDGTGEEA